MDLGDLDAAATLGVAEREVAERRGLGVHRLQLLQHWADLHSDDPRARPGAVPLSRGGDRLIQLGGDGSRQLCWAARDRLEVVALRNHAAGLDLRTGSRVKELKVEPWVGQKVAAMTRELSREQVAIVDAAVADAADESAGRMLAIAEARTIEADLEGYRARLAEDAKRTGLWVSRPKPGDLVDVEGEPDTRRMSAKLPAADVVEADANVDDVADALAPHCDLDGDNPPTRAELRAQTFTLLVTAPHAAASLLDGLDAPASADEPAPTLRKKQRRPATILVHVTDRVLAGDNDGVTRVEAMGPMLLEQVADLVQHRNITLQPVIDLNLGQSVNGYEHPTAVKLRTRLRMVYDVFPHSSSRATGRLDHDHATPYDPGGPPGQTGDHNDAPLTRYHHRAKTHDGYDVRQLGLGAYRWVTPHGLARVVTPRGTRKIEVLRARDGTIAGEIYPGTGGVTCG